MVRPIVELTLYHGTTPESADALCANGWEPNTWPAGGNCGRTSLLCFSTHIDDARWFANEKGCDAVVEANIPSNMLIVDPDDGVGPTVLEEINSPCC